MTMSGNTITVVLGTYEGEGLLGSNRITAGGNGHRHLDPGRDALRPRGERDVDRGGDRVRRRRTRSSEVRAALPARLPGPGRQRHRGGRRRSCASRRPGRGAVAAAGSFSFANSRDGMPIFSATGIAPGDSVSGKVEIANDGELPGELVVAQHDVEDTPGPGGGELSGRLTLRIADVTAPANPVTVYAGPLAPMPARAGGGAGTGRVADLRIRRDAARGRSGGRRPERRPGRQRQRRLLVDGGRSDGGPGARVACRSRAGRTAVELASGPCRHGTRGRAPAADHRPRAPPDPPRQRRRLGSLQHRLRHRRSRSPARPGTGRPARRQAPPRPATALQGGETAPDGAHSPQAAPLAAGGPQAAASEGAPIPTRPQSSRRTSDGPALGACAAAVEPAPVAGSLKGCGPWGRHNPSGLLRLEPAWIGPAAGPDGTGYASVAELYADCRSSWSSDIFTAQEYSSGSANRRA